MRKLEHEDQPASVVEPRGRAVVVEVTERTQADGMPQRPAIDYKVLAEHSPDLIARFDTRRTHLYVNPAAARAGRLSANEYLGLTIAETGVPEPFAATWDHRIGEVSRTGKMMDVEDAFPTPEGIRYFLTRLTPELTFDGSVHSVLSVARDITERRLTEQALRESEARKAAMLQSALDCIVAVDAEGNLTEFNRAAETTFGYRREDVIGKKMATLLIPPARRDEHFAGVVRYQTTGQSTYLGRPVERMALRADGTEFPVAIAVLHSPRPAIRILSGSFGTSPNAGGQSKRRERARRNSAPSPSTPRTTFSCRTATCVTSASSIRNSATPKRT